jgi:hypothetical protein
MSTTYKKAIKYCRRTITSELATRMGRKALSWGTFFDLPTIVWAFMWGGFWAFSVSFWARRWKRVSPGKKYTLAGLPFTLAVCSPPMAIPWLVGDYFGKAGLVATIPIAMLLALLTFKSTLDDESFLGRWRYKHLDIGILYKNRRLRQCKRCGDHDTWGRWVDKPASDTHLSAFAPCRICGALDFDYFYVDRSPAPSS